MDLTRKVKREVRISPDANSLCTAIASAIESEVQRDIATRGECHLVLTGGTVGINLLREIARDRSHGEGAKIGAPSEALRGVIDWSRVHVWWGDERFVDADSPDRNDGQAWDALLNRLPLPVQNVHRMPAATAELDLVHAARRYAHDIEEFFGADFPQFDLTLLGVGPDAHVASLFPGLPGVDVTGLTVIPVSDSPKPPPERVSLTLPSINASRRVWVVAAGADKAPAVTSAFAGLTPSESPVSAVRGVEETVFFVDEAAAADLSSR